VTLVFSSSAETSLGINFVLKHFLDHKNLKAHNATVCFNVSKEEKVGDIYRKILAERKQFNLVDFSVKQTTLDEVSHIPTSNYLEENIND
jgi:hypothetical protein